MRSLDLADGLRLAHLASGEERFSHLAHLRFCFSLLDEASDVDEAIRVSLMTIRHLATLGGNPAKYHVTITEFWVRYMDTLRSEFPGAKNVDDLITVHAELADPSLPHSYWTDLMSEQARTEWVQPDLKQLP